MERALHPVIKTSFVLSCLHRQPKEVYRFGKIFIVEIHSVIDFTAYVFQ